MNEIDLLSHVYQTAEMGQDGITSVLRYSRDPSLRQALERQKREYRELQASARDMLRSRGVQPDGVGAAAKLSSELMSAMKTMVDHSTTKIAEMMIQGSTMGVTKSLRTTGLPPRGPQGKGPGGQAAENRAGQHRGDEDLPVIERGELHDCALRVRPICPLAGEADLCYDGPKGEVLCWLWKGDI